jgi:5-methylcytosine-specific restriction enzyme subunit McrC
MSEKQPMVIELTEFQTWDCPKETFADEELNLLWSKYSNQVRLDFPSPQTNGRLRLTAQGWVGHIPLSADNLLVLMPKVSFENLFGMLEYAWSLKSFLLLEGLTGCASLVDFYERLARILAMRVLERSRQGFYRNYIQEMDHLPYVRGQLNRRGLMQADWDVRFQCHYEEHTADIEENQLLAWTLYIISRSGYCTERVLPTVRRAYRTLQSRVSLLPFRANQCSDRQYNRLNENYRPLHALCRFFLDQSGPSQRHGEQAMLPFLVDMARLFEQFVYEWLKIHLPAQFRLQAQEIVPISTGLTFQIDLVIYDNSTGKACCVLDTKYKTKVNTDDIAQVVAYAQAKHCKTAWLVYPASPKLKLDGQVGDTRVCSAFFSLASNLEEAGISFLARLLRSL